MIDYLYKFPDEQTAKTVLSEYCNSENEWMADGAGFAIDPIGVFCDWDDSDPENPVAIPIDGWHLNLRVTDNRPNPAISYSVTPTNQRRVWF